MANPFGASCGRSITTPPSKTRFSPHRLGTSGARLSNTASGSAQRRSRSSDELACMARHPSRRARNGTTIGLFDRLSGEIAVFGSGL